MKRDDASGHASAFRDKVPLWCSLASRLLGWRPGDFWQATPAELASSIRDPESEQSTAAPSRELIAKMLERDTNG